MLKAPFPYFGGKSKIADTIWAALGQPKHYIEPFFGSGAVLLARPDWRPGMIETVNDSDGFLCNVWRSLQFSPDETAKRCDWPVNHCDLSARRKTLLKKERYLLENLINDEKWHDPELAGYWIWAASCWIGSGLTSLGQIPYISDGGTGIHKTGQRPYIGHGGTGVQDPYNTNIYSWFRTLSERLRYVRVVCGDWSRVCGGAWQKRSGTCGIFFDPPYAVEDRDDDIYHHDSTELAHDVRAWCIERGGDPLYRIVLAGYDEHDNLAAHGWRKENWTAGGGYSNQGVSQGSRNRKRETLYFSPACLDSMPKLF